MELDNAREEFDWLVIADLCRRILQLGSYADSDKIALTLMHVKDLMLNDQSGYERRVPIHFVLHAIIIMYDVDIDPKDEHYCINANRIYSNICMCH